MVIQNIYFFFHLWHSKLLSRVLIVPSFSDKPFTNSTAVRCIISSVNPFDTYNSLDFIKFDLFILIQHLFVPNFIMLIRVIIKIIQHTVWLSAQLYPGLTLTHLIFPVFVYVQYLITNLLKWKKKNDSFPTITGSLRILIANLCNLAKPNNFFPTWTQTVSEY